MALVEQQSYIPATVQYESVQPYASVTQPILYQQPQFVPSVRSGSMPLVPYTAPMAPVYAPQPLVQYQPQELVVAAAPPASHQIVPYEAPTEDWLYETEHDPKANVVKKANKAVTPTQVRCPVYAGTMLRPMMDEAYLCAHLSHQAKSPNYANPGENVQFQSSSGKINVLTMINTSVDSEEIGWRILGDAGTGTNYVIFNGSSDWKYPLMQSSQANFKDVAPNISVKVHNLFLQELNMHVGAIVAILRANPKVRTVLAGHGNGGAFATLCFLILQRAKLGHQRAMVYTFGAPLVVAHPPESKHPLPSHFTSSIHNFVNDCDLVPSMLGSKDLHFLDQMIGASNNPLKTGNHVVNDLKSFKPLGHYYHLTGAGGMIDVPARRETFFLDINRGGSNKKQRLAAHSIDMYVSKLRQVVQFN